MIVDKNQPNDPKIGVNPFFSLVDFIETYISLKEEFEEFEGTFERDEVMEFVDFE
jgi:hypothetical protein